MKTDPVTGRRSFESREDYNAYIASLPPPTADDVTVLADGTRIDTREKALAFMAEMKALSERLTAEQNAAATTQSR